VWKYAYEVRGAKTQYFDADWRRKMKAMTKEK
jgi:hypothetical protein